MKKLMILLFLIGTTAVSLNAQETFEMNEGDTTFVMQKYFMCFLHRGDVEGYDSLALADIQAKHFAHLNQMAEDGKISIAGPFGDDKDLRGIVVFNVATIEESRDLMSEDPAVKAGLLVAEIRPWWAAKGSVLK